MNALKESLFAQILSVIGIIALIIILVQQTGVLNGNNIQSEVQGIFGTMSSKYQATPTQMAGLTTAGAIQQGILPTSWLASPSATSAVDSFGGGVSVDGVIVSSGSKSMKAGTTGANAFELTIGNIPAGDCASAVETAAPNLIGVGAQAAATVADGTMVAPTNTSLAFGGTTSSTYSGAAGGTGLWPITPAVASALCTTATNSNANAVDVSFYGLG